MGKLKVLISSTCYDMKFIRDELRPFISNLGHDPVMSDYDDILYRPSEHSHTSCVNAVEECDMVIFIIGARFGGTSIPTVINNLDIKSLKLQSSKTEALGDYNSISITQAEILKAVSLSIPIYTFIESKIYSQHEMYEANKHDADWLKKTKFSSIQKNEHAAYIFEFFNFIRGRSENNNFKEYSSLSDIKESIKNQWSMLFRDLLLKTESTNTPEKAELSMLNANINIYEKTEGYLELLADIIGKSKREVLFTSTKMAATTAEAPYGKLQKIIIEKSRAFQERNPHRIHYGIIDSGSTETSSGSAELRQKVPDIILRFNKALNSIKVNFLISDEEYVVLRMNKGGGNDRYSALIQNKHLAMILKQYFYSLWNKSNFMSKHLKNVTEKDEQLLEDILEFVGSKKVADLFSFLDLLNDIDESSQSVPSEFMEKIMQVDDSHFIDEKNLIKDKYKKYYKENIEKKGVELSDINIIKRNILNNSPINYKKSAHAFFVQYFLSNYYKARHSLECLSEYINHMHEISILDLGGGGGASALALTDYIRDEKLGVSRIDIIDNSEEQLSITKNIIGVYHGEMNFLEKDAYDHLKDNGLEYDLIFAANFLCEANSQTPLESMPSLIKNALSKNGRLLVVERAESKVYENLEASGSLSLRNYMYQNIRFKIPFENSYFEFIDDSSGSSIRHFIKKEYTLRYALYA